MVAGIGVQVADDAGGSKLSVLSLPSRVALTVTIPCASCRKKSDPRATGCRPPATVLTASPPCPVGIRRLVCPWANRDSSNLLGERSEMQRSAQRLQHLYRLEVPFTP